MKGFLPKKAILLLAISSLFPFYKAFAQEASDSLYIRAQLRQVEQMLYAEPDAAEQAALHALQYANAHRHPWGQMVANLTLGMVCLTLQKNEEARVYFETALAQARSIHDIKGEINALNNLGNYYFVKEDTDQALAYYEQSLALEEQHPTPNLAASYLNIGLVYRTAGYPEKAKAHYLKSLAVETGYTPQTKLHAAVSLSSLYLDEGALQMALSYADTALWVARQLHSDEGIGRSHSLKAQGWLAQGLFEAAISGADSALYYLPQGEPRYNAYICKAEALAMQGQLKKAEQLLLQEAPPQDTALSLSLRRDALQQLYQILKKAGDPAGSLRYLELLKVAEDSLNARASRQELTRRLVQFEAERKEKEIQRLEQQALIKDLQIQQRNFLIAAGALIASLLLSGLYLFFRQRRLLAAQENLQIRLRWRRAQLNPHFFFNALMSVKTLILAGDTNKASRSMSQLGRLMRRVLESSNSEMTTLDDELQFLKDYLALQQLSTEFEWQIAVTPEDLDVEDIQIPAMLLQPFVENAIEHGLRYLEDGQRMLRIHFEERGSQQLAVSITDNGIGRSGAKAGKHPYPSRATEITEDRQKLMKGKFSYEIIDLSMEDGSTAGTQVAFILNI